MIHLGQAYIISLKDGNNSIIIVGGTNAAYDPHMTELDKEWTETIKKGKKAADHTEMNV